MIYILKFIAAFLLPPGLFVLLGIILSAYLWRQRKRFGRFAFSLSVFLTLLLYFSSTLLGAKLLGQPLENRYSQQQPASAQRPSGQLPLPGSCCWCDRSGHSSCR